MDNNVPALKYRNNIYSQNGEDGILHQLLLRFPNPTNWVCEFGAFDGKLYSNTFLLVMSRQCSAIYIECDRSRFDELLKTTNEHPSIIPIFRSVEADGENTLDLILSSTPIPKDFDVLSIDIDSFDYQVWDSVKVYRPRIVVIEINSGIPPNRFDSIYDPNDPRKVGTGFLPMTMLGITKGYTLVCHTGNLIFVRNDYTQFCSDLIVPAEQCYISNWLFN